MSIKEKKIEVSKETRFNPETRQLETKHEVWLSDYDTYAMTWELQMRILKTKSMRDKCGISPDNKKAEANMHIATIEKLAKQLGITFME